MNTNLSTLDVQSLNYYDRVNNAFINYSFSAQNPKCQNLSSKKGFFVLSPKRAADCEAAAQLGVNEAGEAEVRTDTG